jgi:glycopeptide antibiotics resistance protein
MTPRVRWWVTGVGVAYLGGLAVLLLWPNGGQVRRLNLDLYLFFLRLGVPPAVTPGHYAFALNILIFAPPVFAVALVTRGTSVWWWAWAGALTSGSIELLQRLALPSRVPSWSDVVANSLGAVLGAGAALVVRRRTSRRDAEPTARPETTSP